MFTARPATARSGDLTVMDSRAVLGSSRPTASREYIYFSADFVGCINFFGDIVDKIMVEDWIN